MNQLEIFHDFMIQQQLQFHSLLLSQKVNQQFQKNIRKSMRHEIKRLLHPPATALPSAASPLNGSRNNSNEQQQNQQTNQPTVRKNSNPADSLQQASILSSAVGLGNLRSSMILDTQILPAERHEFYLYAQEAVDCISKDYQAIDDFNVSMEITWRLIPFIILPLPPAAFSSKKGGGLGGGGLDISKKNREGPFLFSCYYNGDNEGNGRYRWQIDKYSHEYQSISTPTNLKLSPTKHQGISIMLGLSIEDCTQLFNWMFMNSFWIDA